jgi:hypothetical protein
MDIKLVALDDKSGFDVVGLNPNYNVRFNYDRQTNTVSLCTQPLGEPLSNGNLIYLLAYDIKGGRVTWTDNIGMMTKWNEETQSYDWVDNGVWGSYVTSGYTLAEMPADLSGLAGWLNDSHSAYFINGSDEITWLTSLKKK